MNKHFNIKKFLILSFVSIFTISCITGCGEKSTKKRYKNYIDSLITSNYQGDSNDHIKSDGQNESDAEKLQAKNAERLAKNLISYYGIEASNCDTILPDMTKVAKTIYSKVQFTISDVYSKDDTYYVDIRISPINIISDTDSEINDYISNMNERINAGEFNNYEKGDYEKEFADGIMAILANAADNMTYADPVVVTVKIINDNKNFYISEDDFLKIDSAIINVSNYSGN